MREELRKALDDLGILERAKGVDHPDTLSMRSQLEKLQKMWSDSAREAARAARQGHRRVPLAEDDRESTINRQEAHRQEDAKQEDAKKRGVPYKDPISEAYKKSEGTRAERDAVEKTHGKDSPEWMAAHKKFLKAQDDYDQQTFKFYGAEDD